MTESLFDVKHTERSMLDELHRRYNNHLLLRRGNGPRWVCAEHVRSDAGFWAQRTADFVVVDLWPSTGNAVHGHEVKVSRSDWLCEMRKPEKSLPFMELVDHWWLVVSDAAIVKRDELPEKWGLMVLGSSGLRVKVQAPKLTPAPLPKGFMASLLRSTAKTAVKTNILSENVASGGEFNA